MNKQGDHRIHTVIVGGHDDGVAITEQLVDVASRTADQAISSWFTMSICPAMRGVDCLSLKGWLQNMLHTRLTYMILIILVVVGCAGCSNELFYLVSAPVRTDSYELSQSDGRSVVHVEYGRFGIKAGNHRLFRVRGYLFGVEYKNVFSECCESGNAIDVEFELFENGDRFDHVEVFFDGNQLTPRQYLRCDAHPLKNDERNSEKYGDVPQGCIRLDFGENGLDPHHDYSIKIESIVKGRAVDLMVPLIPREEVTWVHH